MCCGIWPGTHLLGALPQHIFSLPPAVAGSVTAARINLFAASQLSVTVPATDGSHANTTVSVDTTWPLAPEVGVGFTKKKHCHPSIL